MLKSPINRNLDSRARVLLNNTDSEEDEFSLGKPQPSTRNILTRNVNFASFIIKIEEFYRKLSNRKT